MEGKKSNTIDIASIDSVNAANNGADLELVHPTSGERLGIVITLAGADSDAYRREQHIIQGRRLKTLTKRRQKNLTAAEIEEESLDILAAVTLGWRGMVEDGAEVPYSKENVRRIYGKYPWITEQADEFVHDRANFLLM